MDFKRLKRIKEDQIISQEIKISSKSVWDLLIENGKCRYCSRKINSNALINFEYSTNKCNIWVCECGFCITTIEED